MGVLLEAWNNYFMFRGRAPVICTRTHAYIYHYGRMRIYTTIFIELSESGRLGTYCNQCKSILHRSSTLEVSKVIFMK